MNIHELNKDWFLAFSRKLWGDVDLYILLIDIFFEKCLRVTKVLVIFVIPKSCQGESVKNTEKSMSAGGGPRVKHALRMFFCY